MEDPQNTYKKRLTLDNLKTLEKIIKAAVSGAEILIGDVDHDSEEAINQIIIEELETV